jgi:branched-chain amino acid transport system substrate-binding protein
MEVLMRIIRTAALVSAIAVLAAGCGGSNNDSGGSDTIKLGAWYPLTGAQASSGIPQRAGAAAFWAQVNANGGIHGKKVDFIAKDNAFDPQQTIQVSRELVAKDKVDAIVNTNGTATTEATFPFVLEQNKVPIFGTYGGSAAWYAKPRAGLFGTQALYEDQAVVAADWAVEEGAKNVTIVRDDPEAFVNVEKAAGKSLKAEGASSNVVSVKIGTTDYGPAVSQVKKKSPDAVLLILPPQEAAAYLNEAALQGVKTQSYGYSPAATESTIELAGKNAEGFRAVSLTLPATSPDPAIKEYRDAMAKYGKGAKPDLYSLATYGYAKVFAQILESIDGDINKESITKAIASASKSATDIVPEMSFSATDHLGTDAVVRVEVEGGKYVAKGDFESPKN